MGVEMHAVLVEPAKIALLLGLRRGITSVERLEKQIDDALAQQKATVDAQAKAKEQEIMTL